jgi:hypothetical protein
MAAPEELVTREELTATLFAILDLNENVERITDILEEEFGGENPEETA